MPQPRVDLLNALLQPGTRERVYARRMSLLLAAALLAAPCTATLGVDLTDISHAHRRARGVPGYVAGGLVRVVWAGGPAGLAGINAGDVIQGVGDQLVQNACDVRNAVAKRGCGSVRVTLRRGVETLTRDVRLADVKRFKRKPGRCEDGDGAACTALAKAHGDDVVLLRQACDLGDAEGCFMLGLALGNGKEGAAAYEQACDFGNPLGCTNLGWIYQYGKDVAVDLEAAARLYTRGCDGTRCSGRNLLGCVNLGRMYRDGIGVKQDAQRAIVLFKDVCERGDPHDAENAARACSAAGTTSIYGKGVEPDVAAALLLLEKGCDGGDTMGCFNLGVLYELGNEVPRDVPRALGYYKRSCDRGDAEACERGAALRR